MIVLYLTENGETVFSCCSSHGRSHAYRMLYQNYQHEIGKMPAIDLHLDTISDNVAFVGGYEIMVRDWLAKPENQHLKVCTTLNNEITV